jgi:hypothetical protein
MLPVNWIDLEAGEVVMPAENLHALTDGYMRNLIINIGRKDTHIEILEGVIRAIGGAQ